MTGITFKNGNLVMLLNGNPVAALVGDTMYLSTYRNKCEEVRKYINTFSKYVEVSLKVNNDWTVTYKNLTVPFTGCMSFK